jgi:hypothetical protein
MMDKLIGSDMWNNQKICRIATGWPIADIDQIDNKGDFVTAKRIVDFNLDSAKLAQTLADVGVEVFCFHATSHSGNVWYNSKVAKKFTALGERDLLEELTRECGKRGIESTCLMQVVCNQRAHDEHPEWCQINSEGEACNVSPRVCFNNPEYRIFFLAMLEEVASYDIKAILLDEFDFNGRYGGGLMCYCKHCKALFAKKYGAPIPQKEDWHNPQWLNFIQFRFDSLTNFLKDVKTRLRQTSNEVMLSIISYSDIGVNWKRLQPVEEFSKYLDFFCLDAEGIVHAPMLARLFNAYSKEKAEIMGASIPPLGQFIIKEPEIELKSPSASICEIMTVLSHNLSWNMDIGYKLLPQDQVIAKDILELYSAGVAEIQKRRKWVLGKQDSFAQIAIFYSERSKVFYGQSRQQLYYSEFLGYFEILLNSGHIFDLVGVKHLNETNLNRYKLIILPAASCLSADDSVRIREYVSEGGKIIASYNTSLCDEYGKEYKDFALSDVFGCSVENKIPSVDYLLRENCRQIRNKEIEYGFISHISFDKKVSAYALPTPTIIIKNNTGKIRGDFFYPKKGSKTYCPGFVNSLTFSEKSSPLIVENKFGKGHAIYIGAKLGALYAEAAVPFAAKVILNEIDSLIGNELDFRVIAPGSIEATAFKQTKKRIVVHLNNRQAIPVRFNVEHLIIPSLYEAENVLPARNIKVEIRNLARNQIARIYIAPECEIVELREMPGVLIAEIPEIHYHSMLVIELI